jgi:very-short-patch-repair endonuclease
LENKEDKLRDRWLEEQGYEVLRFCDNEVFKNMEGVLEFIREKLLSPSPSPSPSEGRGKYEEKTIS